MALPKPGSCLRLALKQQKPEEPKLQRLFEKSAAKSLAREVWLIWLDLLPARDTQIAFCKAASRAVHGILVDSELGIVAI
eukprot:Skav208116  [mRNA]  locus=scaffold2016:50376:50615:- [translate_table: standard]